MSAHLQAQHKQQQQQHSPRRPSATPLLYSPADHARIVDLFSVQVGFLRAAAGLPHDLQRWLPPWLARPLAGVYCTFIVSLTLHLVVMYLKTTYDMLQHGELDEITDALTMTIIYSFSTYATCYFLWHSRRLMAFLMRINHQHWHHSLAGLSYVSAHRSYMWAREMTIYWLVACIAGVTLWGVAPIILRIRVLPLNCWYPFDAMQPFVFELLYVLQLLAQVMMGMTFGNGSALFVTLVVIMLGQYDVLYCSLKNLSYHGRLRAGEPLETLCKEQQSLPMGEHDELNQYEFAQEHLTDARTLQQLQQRLPVATLDQALHLAIVQCVQLHRFVLESCRELEELFNPYCLIKSLQITLQLCLLAFVGVAGERSTMRILNLVQYLALTATELLMFTYCGELLRGHSVRCGEAFFRSQWWTHATVIRQDILILLVNSKRAVRLTAGKFYAMDVERFRSVVTQAFSFLTLLQKLAAKDQLKNN